MLVIFFKNKKFSFMVGGKVASRFARYGFDHWLGTLCCALGQDTLLSQYLCSQLYKWVPVT